jgi:hypothetical protein
MRVPLQIETLRSFYKIGSRDSGDVEIREEFGNLRRRDWGKTGRIPALLVSSSAYFKTPVYRDLKPHHQTAKWEWRDEGSRFRRGVTVFDPPIARNPISFIRERITFNTICFNRRDRLDSGALSKEADKERIWQYLEYPHGEILIQIVFPDGVPEEIWVEARKGSGTSRNPSPGYSQKIKSGFRKSENTVELAIEKPRPGFSYHIVWKLPEDEESFLKATDAGFLRDIQAKLRMLPHDQSNQQQVRAELEILRERLEATYPSGDLNLALYAYSRVGERGALVCVSDLKSPKPNTAPIAIGRTLVGRCYRRKRAILFNTLKPLTPDDLYYEPVPGEEQQRPPTVALCWPLLYPGRNGGRAGVLYVTTRSHMSALGSLLDSNQTKGECVALLYGWYASQLIPTLRNGKTLPAASNSEYS